MSDELKRHQERLGRARWARAARCADPKYLPVKRGLFDGDQWKPGRSADGRFTIGVELEYWLTWWFGLPGRQVFGGLRHVASPLREPGGALPPGIFPELPTSMIEIASGVSPTVAAAIEDILRKQDRVAEAARAVGIVLMAAGTPPVGEDATIMAITVDPRPGYLAMHRDVDSLWIAGTHVHAGVSSRETAIRVSNVGRRFLPHILALSANSRFLLGRDTGFQSVRPSIFRAYAGGRGGPPRHYRDWAEFVAFVRHLEDEAGRPLSWNDVWADIRITGFGTVELRAGDSGNLDAAAWQAALWQCIVATLDDPALPDPLGLRSLGEMDTGVLIANMANAERHGLAASVRRSPSDPEHELRSEVQALIAGLRPVARELGCEEDPLLAENVLSFGTPADHQFALHARGGLTNVARGLVVQTSSGIRYRPEVGLPADPPQRGAGYVRLDSGARGPSPDGSAPPRPAGAPALWHASSRMAYNAHTRSGASTEVVV